MNSSLTIAYDDASYEADAAVVAASADDFRAASGHVRTAFDAVRSSPYISQVETVHTLGVDAVVALTAPDADRDSVLLALEAFRRAVESCHVRAHAEVRSV